MSQRFNLLKSADIEVGITEELNEAAAQMAPGPERDRLLKTIARREKAHADVERWANSPGLQPPNEEMTMPHVTSRSWTDADIVRLKKLSDEGATVARAAAALNRKTDAVKKKCRLHGFNLVGTREAKANIRRLEASMA